MTEAFAQLHDGVGAMAHRVRVILQPLTLRLIHYDGRALDWPLAQLRLVDRLAHEMRVAPLGSPERLVVSDPAMMAALHHALAPARGDVRRRRLRFALIAAAIVPLLGAGLWFGWPPIADGIARAIPPAWEEPLGTALVDSLGSGQRRCTAPEGMAALERLSARLAHAGGLDRPVTLHVLDNPMVNALAAPGGQVVVFRGLLTNVESPEEFAGVLAHELGHVRHRHGIRAAVRAAGLGLFVSVLIGGSDLGSVAVGLMALSYSRAFELDADLFAADVLRGTGIGTEGLAAFFARMEGVAPSGRSVWAYLHTHPHSGERSARLLRAAAPETRQPAMPAADWAAIRAICGGARPPMRPPAPERRQSPASEGTKT